MPTMTPTDAEQELAELAARFDHWRRTRDDTQDRIPRELWDAAVAVAQRLPYTRVAKHLRLSPKELKQRLTAALATTPATLTTPPDFVEITVPLPTAALAPSLTVIEIERPDGARMRLRYAEAPPLAVLLQAFLEPASCCN